MPRKLDLTGKKYGNLKVIRPVKGKPRYQTWECQCDCGNSIKVDSRHLRQGITISCGSCEFGQKKETRGRTADDLSGKVFGRLTVLERAENKRGLVVWKCRCSCGNLINATAHDLKMGLKKSCGCLKKEARNKLDITGKRFGKLVALYPTGKTGSSGSVIWRCKCDCGNEVDICVSDLNRGNNKSCGCLKSEYQKMVRERLHVVDGTCIEWLDGRKDRCDNSSGFRGVHRKKNGKYIANIGFKKKIYYLGIFDEYAEAVKCRKHAEELVHGGFLKAHRLWVEKAERDPAWGENNPLVFEVEKEDGVLVVHNSMEKYMGDDTAASESAAQQSMAAEEPRADMVAAADMSDNRIEAVLAGMAEKDANAQYAENPDEYGQQAEEEKEKALIKV